MKYTDQGANHYSRYRWGWVRDRGVARGRVAGGRESRPFSSWKFCSSAPPNFEILLPVDPLQSPLFYDPAKSVTRPPPLKIPGYTHGEGGAFSHRLLLIGVEPSLVPTYISRFWDVRECFSLTGRQLTAPFEFSARVRPPFGILPFTVRTIPVMTWHPEFCSTNSLLLGGKSSIVFFTTYI